LNIIYLSFGFGFGFGFEFIFTFRNSYKIMIKKTFSKTFYALFFSTFLILNAGDALATAITNDDITSLVAANTNCATDAFCGDAAGDTPAGVTICAPITQELTVTIKSATGGITRSFYKCNGTAALDQAQLRALCMVNCQFIVSRLKGDVADEVYNTSQNTFTKSMCNALRVVTGSAGKTFAAFAIIATGIGFFTGKVSWGLMIGVTAGIATMFGAPSIVAAISGQDLKTSCKIN
jgi:type IV secretory pathway VirB2 component (pilin)